MNEFSNTLIIDEVAFIYLCVHLFHRLNAFMQKLIDFLIQIFRNLQNFPRSWIARIATFFMSGLSK